MRTSYGNPLLLSLGLLTSLAGAMPSQPALAASAPPVFTPTAQTAWVGIGIGAGTFGAWNVPVLPSHFTSTLPNGGVPRPSPGRPARGRPTDSDPKRAAATARWRCSSPHQHG